MSLASIVLPACKYPLINTNTGIPGSVAMTASIPFNPVKDVCVVLSSVHIPSKAGKVIGLGDAILEHGIPVHVLGVLVGGAQEEEALLQPVVGHK